MRNHRSNKTAASRRTITARARQVQASAFTLVELLVVVAIIALLVSILIPSLKAAKDMAKLSVCLMHQRGFARSNTLYNADNDGWIAGPNTSGAIATLGGRPSNHLTGSHKPVNDWDWLSPIISDSIGLSDNYLMRFQQICMTDFRCPSNDTRYVNRYQGPGLPMNPEHPYILSYITPTYFHLYPTGTPGALEVNNTDEAIRLPSYYAPKADKVGQPSDKVFTFEGGRYSTVFNGKWGLDYTTEANTSGVVGSPQGNFTSRGYPFDAGGEPYHRAGRDAVPEDYVVETFFRHRGEMTMAFFDEHAEAMDTEQADQPRLYVPSKSTVQNPGAIWPAQKLGLRRGDVLD